MNSNNGLHKAKTVVKAHVADWRFGHPSNDLYVILVVGQDGAAGTIAFLASILRAAGNRVGTITSQFVEIVDRRVEGSGKPGVSGDPFKLQSLLAQMRRAKCEYVLVEVPPELPMHQFTGVKPTMIVVRRCGDSYSDSITTAAQVSVLNNVLARKPQFVIINKDDPAAGDLARLSSQEGMISFGENHKSDCQIKNVQLHPKGSAVDVVVDHQTTLQLVTILAGRQAIYNAVAAAMAAYALRMEIEIIEQGVFNTEAHSGWFELVPVQRPYKLILDDSHTPSGLADTIEVLRHFTSNRLIVVYGPSLEVLPAWRQAVGEIVGKNADRLVICDNEVNVGHNAVEIRKQIMEGVAIIGGDAKADEIPDRKAAIEKALSIARRGDVVLIASSVKTPYRQMDKDRINWSDHKIISDILD